MMQRRAFALGAATLAVLCGTLQTAPVFAAPSLPYEPKGDPFDFVVNLTNGVLDKIRGDKSLQAGDLAQVRRLVDEVIMPALDFPMMTRMTVGPKWRQATAEQRKALQDGFEDLLMRVYSGALGTVTDQRCELRPTRSRAVRDEMVVRTLLKSDAGRSEPIGIDYRIYRAKSGEWKVVDVNVEGIWMVENYRSQFASVLSQDGVDGLIKLFREKGESLAKTIKSPGTASK